MQQGMVMVHVDARRFGVSVPTEFKSEFHLRLNLSRRFVPPTPIELDDDGFTALLTFESGPFNVRVPWEALFAITGKEFLFWAESAPLELMVQPKPRPAFKLIQGGLA